ncbi:unnamed protein product [Lota lota]
MDFSVIFQRFENSLSTYSGNDPLDYWNSFIENLGKRLPPNDATDVFVLERLVKWFLLDKRYANDVRYVNHCINFASYYTEPISLYAYFYSKGVGMRTASLYVAWAQQFEQSGALEQAEAVYQRAVENQAQPADTVLQEYSSLFNRTTSEHLEEGSASSLFNRTTSEHLEEGSASSLFNRTTSEHLEEGSASSLFNRTTSELISRSDNVGVRASSSSGGTQTVSAYQKESLVCDGLELSFEEVRAARYFLKIRHEEERREFVSPQGVLFSNTNASSRRNVNAERQIRLVQEKEEKIVKLKHTLEALNQELGGPLATPSAPLQVKHKPPAPFTTMPPAGWSVFNDEGATASTSNSTQALPHPHPAAPRVSLEVSVCQPAEAEPRLDSEYPRGFQLCSSKIHTLAVSLFCLTSIGIDILSQGATASFSSFTPNTSLGLVSATPSRVLPSPTVNTREALDVIMDMFQAPTLFDDPYNNTSLENAASSEAVFMRNGKRGGSLPNHVVQYIGDYFNVTHARVLSSRLSVQNDRKPSKQSIAPKRVDGTSELTPDESTVWGVCYNSLNSLAACPNSTRDFVPSAQGVSTPFTSKPHFFADSYQDQGRHTLKTLTPHPSQEAEAQEEEETRSQEPIFVVPMSPDCGLKPDWLVLRSPETITEPDLDAFISPQRTPEVALAWDNNKDVSMSPDRGVYSCAEVPMSPMVPGPAAGSHLVSDPWDGMLIAALLSRLSPPLGSHPHCISWQCNVPNITPKTTITMGNASLRVDCLLGEGAFAKIYQATDPMTSEKMVMKVQKPANPWEFYMNTQLDGRLPPAVRHLYIKVQSAHLFHNGSILLAELHRCGTLLNAVNQYKKLSDKVMPQPLVMYFTTCMLHMVEQLHRIRLVHADIKPDNFLLGERFLESQCLDPDVMEHGMVLVDLGQSIDMDLFPKGTEFTARCLTSGFQCTEMLSGRPWSYQTDYFGIAGTVYCMLFGTYMQVKQEDGVWKTNALFRRNPHSELWLELFHTLLNIPDGGSLPCLRSLRCRLSTVLRETYGSKLQSLKNRLVVLLLENLRSARR